MRKFVCYFLLVFGVTLSASAQNLNEFRYVRVPEKFDFLKEENQYQLNALTAFLFEKYGFEVFYKENEPRGTDPCEVLQANVHSDSNLFRSKLYVTLENCQNETVFTSETGSSREKDFKVSYHEALRDAFTSVEKLNYNFVAGTKDASVEKTDSNELPGEIVVDPVVTADEIEEETSATASSEEKNETAKDDEGQKFLNGAVTYTLKETPVGFELFRQGEDEKFASLMKSGGGKNYLYSSKSISGNAFFDREGNLVVEYLEPDSQQLITVNYKLQAQ